MDALVFRHGPACGLPLLAVGSALQDWIVYSVQQNDGPVVVVIRQRREPGC